MSVRYLLLCSCFLCGFARAEIDAGTQLYACGDAAQWPPYHYYDQSSHAGGKQVRGFDYDLLIRILEPHGIQIKLELIPWHLCLERVRHGRKYHLAVSASPSPLRSKNFLPSQPYYHTRTVALMRGGVTAAGTEPNFKEERYCALYGRRFKGLKELGVSELQREVSYQHLLDQLEKGNCEVVVARIELLMGKLLSRELQSEAFLIPSAMPELPEDPFVLLVSRRYEYAKQLRQLLNQGIQRLKDSGELDQMLSGHLSDDLMSFTEQGWQLKAPVH